LSCAAVRFTVPLVPPSVNHYKVPIWKRRGFYVTAEAKAFKAAVGIFRRGAVFGAADCEVRIRVYLGKGGRGDADNFGKVCLDSLVDCGVIKSDAAVKRINIEKHRDWYAPRTEFTISPI